jgi:hypothetical protein
MMRPVKMSVLMLLMLAALLPAAAQDTNLLSRLEPVPPLPEVGAIAKTDNIPLEGMLCPPNTDTLAPGDSVTALITLHQRKNRRTQWLVYFQVVSNAVAKPEKPATLYTSTGNKFVFTGSPVTFRIRTVGPYVNAASIWGEPVPKDNSVPTVTVNKGYLSLGLEKGTAIFYRWKQAEKAKRKIFHFSFGNRPYPESEIAKAKKAVAEFDVTTNEERDVAGGYLALMSYFSAVSETPNLESIMMKVTSFPSVWSIVKHGGIHPWMGFDYDSIAPIDLPDSWRLPTRAPVYTLPLAITLNGQPALTATFLVTDSRPPLMACSGIVGFLAQDPDDDESYMTLRIISARCNMNAQKPADKNRTN